MEESQQGGIGAKTDPPQNEVDRFKILYKAHLSSSSDGLGEDSEAWEKYQRGIPASQKNFFDDVQQKLRMEYHANIALERRDKLSSLLVQTPPFTQSIEDKRFSKSRRGQKKRYNQVEQFVNRFASRSAIGVHPFFASLKRLLEYQGSGQLDRSCQWLLDDAVLMESGGDDWLESVLWIMKGVLQFKEEGVGPTSDPFVCETESLRWWTVDPSLTDPECSTLARLIPSFVLPRRGRGSQAVQRIIGDEENLNEIELVTGKIRISESTFRDDDYRGSLVDRLWSWLMSRWY